MQWYQIGFNPNPDNRQNWFFPLFVWRENELPPNFIFIKVGAIHLHPNQRLWDGVFWRPFDKF